MRPSLYVYYKLTDQPRATLAEVVRALQAELSQSAGVHARLMQRRDDANTWMEVYEDIADAAVFNAVLLAALKRHGFDRFGLARYDEWFVPMEVG